MPEYTSLTDGQLVASLNLGDEKAFAEIYHRYWEKLLAIGYHYTREKQAAEDIVHEVMMSLWIRRSHLNVQSLSSYLGTATKFAVFKAIARERRRRELIAGSPLDEYGPDIQTKLDALFLEQSLRGAIDELPEKTKLVFTFSREFELTVKEIATKLDLSPKAVEYHITKALRSLRSTLRKIKSFFI